MNQEVVTGVQKAAGWFTVGSGTWAWFGQNATALTALATIVTGIIFAVCAIWNASSNHRRNSINKRDIIESIITDIDEDDLTDKEIKKFKKSLRKH
jgi:hypothetical protein